MMNDAVWFLAGVLVGDFTTLLVLALGRAAAVGDAQRKAAKAGSRSESHSESHSSSRDA